MYKLTQHECILRMSDGANIPLDATNADYQCFLEWQSAGNEPDPADVPHPNVGVLAQIAAIETMTMVPRITREALLLMAEDLAEREAALRTAAGMPTTRDELLAENVGYQRTLAVDLQIRSLREQLT